MSGYAEAFSAAIQATIQTTIDMGAAIQEPSVLATAGLALGGLTLAALVTGRGERSTSFDGLAQPNAALPPSAGSSNLGVAEARIAGSTADPGAQGVLGISTPGGGE